MIRVMIELLPHGYETNKQLLGLIEIANDCTGTLATGNYNAWIGGKDMRELRRVSVKDFPRKRLLVHDLLFRVLREAFGKRNGETK